MCPLVHNFIFVASCLFLSTSAVLQPTSLFLPERHCPQHRPLCSEIQRSSTWPTFALPRWPTRSKLLPCSSVSPSSKVGKRAVRKRSTSMGSQRRPGCGPLATSRCSSWSRRGWCSSALSLLLGGGGCQLQTACARAKWGEPLDGEWGVITSFTAIFMSLLSCIYSVHICM